MSSTASARRAVSDGAARTDTTTPTAAPADGAGPGLPTAEVPYTGLGREGRRVFIGLMIGMLVASISQTIVSPAMPRIVAELGGMDHYSWIATAAMLVSAVTVPIVGKLSDLYGRRSFYLGGLVVFMIGSIICGVSQDFWLLVAGRAVQGLGMGTLMPLSQTIIGDIIPPRQRGKYQGVMGAVFGVTSVAGPLAGGFITDHLGWRWLFFVTLPLGVAAFIVIFAFLHLKHERRDAKVDVFGIITLTAALVTILLATTWGGTTYPWDSMTIIGMYVAGAILLTAFIIIETRVSEPLLPLRLFANSVFTFANIASFCVAIAMFGAIFYIPVYAQGVMKVDATNSGLITMPLMLSLVVMGILGGLIVTKTGRYKEIVLAGVLVMGVGYFMLTQLSYGDPTWRLTLCMLVMGIGLGACMQNFTLIVQNTAARRDLGVATASSQFFRNVGSTVGVAVFGTIMTGQLKDAIMNHLSPEVLSQVTPEQLSSGVGAVLDPTQLAMLPAPLAEAIRNGLADALHVVFIAALPVIGLAFIAALLIKAVPLRDTVHTSEEAGQEMLDGLSQSSADPDRVPLGRGDGGRPRTSERLLALELGLLAEEAERPERDLLRQAITDLGQGEYERGRSMLRRSAAMLASEEPQLVADCEPAAVEFGSRSEHRGFLSPALREVLASEGERIGSNLPADPTDEVATHRADLDAMRKTSGDLVAALLVDLARDRENDAVASEPSNPRHAAG